MWSLQVIILKDDGEPSQQIRCFMALMVLMVLIIAQSAALLNYPETVL